MPPTTSYCHRVLILCLLFLALGSRARAQELTQYKVVYTGSLFGYFRYPEVQDLSQNGCPEFDPAFDPAKRMGDPEQAFKSAMDNAANSIDKDNAVKSAEQQLIVRVAVGDNFSPYLLARQAWNPDPNFDRLVPKEEYSYLPKAGNWVRVTDDKQLNRANDDTLQLYHGEGVVPMDNVGCFLRLMHFDAIVPGEFDFYFGPERLRQVARFLKTPASPSPKANVPDFMPVRMLGANLSLKTRYVDPNSPQEQSDSSGDDSSPSKSGPKGPVPPIAPATLAPTATLPKVVLPWLRSVNIKNAIVVQAQKVGATSPQEPNAVMLLKEADFTSKQETSFWKCMQDPDFWNSTPDPKKIPPCEIQGAVERASNWRITRTDGDAIYAFAIWPNLKAACIDPSTTKNPSNKVQPTCDHSWAPLSLRVGNYVKTFPKSTDCDPHDKELLCAQPTVDLDYGLPKTIILQPNTACAVNPPPSTACEILKPNPNPKNTYQLKIIRSGLEAVQPPAFGVQLPYLEDPRNSSNQPGAPGVDPLKYEIKPWVPEDSPWACVSTTHGNVAVFGVVDPNLGELIGRLNDTWYSIQGGNPGTQFSDNTHEETDLQVSDPAEALQQVLQYFNERSKEADFNCKDAHRILLAQMAQSQAYDLAARLKLSPFEAPFDFVIAKADPDRATGKRDITKYYEPNPSDTAPKPLFKFRDPLVLVPGIQYSPEDPYGLKVRVQDAILTDVTDVNAKDERIVKNRVESSTLGFCRMDAPCVESSTLESCPPAASCVKSSTLGVCSSAVPCDVDPMRDNSPLQTKLAQPSAFNLSMSIGQIIQTSAKQLNSNSALHSALKDVALQTGQKVYPLGINDWKNADWNKFFEDLGLTVMRQTCHSDLAFVQHRDVFLPMNYSESQGQFFHSYDERGIEALLDIVFWKGDFIQCMNLPGSTITSLLQTSKQFQDQEDLGVMDQVSQGWALATLGVTGQGSKTQLIDGQYLDPKKLYSVAITDYLANGDTGYPALQGAEPYPAAAWDKLPMNLLSYKLIKTLVPNSKLPPEPRSDEAFDVLLTDTSPVPKKPTQPGVGAWFANLTSINKQAKITPLDQSVRDLPHLSISLYKLDGSYSILAHRDSLKTVGENFPGVSSVDLTSPESLSYGFDHLARVQYDFKHWLLFGQSELNYGEHNQRGKPPNEAYQPSQTADFYSIQTGPAIRLFPHFQNPASLTFQVPLELDTQIIKPLTQFNIIQNTCPPNVTCPKASSTPPPVYAAPSRYYSYRPGFRYSFSFLRPQQPGQGGQSGGQSSGQAKGQSGQGGGGGGAGQGGSGSKGQGQSSTLDSYLEVGFANGQLRNGPNAFTFMYTGTPPAGSTLTNPETCYVANLQTCIPQLQASSIAAHLIGVTNGRVHGQGGIYLNFRVDMPLWNYSEFTLENLGNFYFNRHNDAVVDTRYWDDLKASITVPIYRKISLAPTYEVFWFKNKVAYNIYSSQSAYVSLNYSFAWHTGLNWRKVLQGYSDPVPTLPSLPTR